MSIETNPPADPSADVVLEALEEAGVLPTDRVATKADCTKAAARQRLLAMSQAGLIERRETEDGYVWLTWNHSP